jgi:hypothetical protein
MSKKQTASVCEEDKRIVKFEKQHQLEPGTIRNAMRLNRRLKTVEDALIDYAVSMSHDDGFEQGYSRAHAEIFKGHLLDDHNDLGTIEIDNAWLRALKGWKDGPSHNGIQLCTYRVLAHQFGLILVPKPTRGL